MTSSGLRTENINWVKKTGRKSLTISKVEISSDEDRINYYLKEMNTTRPEPVYDDEIDLVIPKWDE